MPTYKTSHSVDHSAHNMYALVADVEQYPQFVPLCEELIVRGRKKLDDGREILVADMTVAYKLFRETFTSRVTLMPFSGGEGNSEGEILVEYLDGPFRHLENRWSFKELEEGRSEVGFFIDYEFKNRTLGAVMGVMFDRAFRKFSTAFEARADEIYKVI